MEQNNLQPCDRVISNFSDMVLIFREGFYE